MKIRTNLEPDQLLDIAKGLAKASVTQVVDKAPPLANKAEEDLLMNATTLFNTMLTSLKKDCKAILEDK